MLSLKYIMFCIKFCFGFAGLCFRRVRQLFIFVNSSFAYLTANVTEHIIYKDSDFKVF